MSPFYFYIYLILVAATIITFTIARCYFNFHYFDILFYPNQNNNIFKNKVFLAYHIAVNVALGLLFGFQVVNGMLIKIVAYEWYLYATEYCDIFETSKVSNLIVVIMLSIISYSIGASLYPYFNFNIF